MATQALQVYVGETADRAALPVRGVGWVLRWAAVVTLLSYAAVVLAAFLYQVSAERALHQAARVGLREAALPRATSESVESAIRGHLAARHSRLRAASLQLTANGRRLSGPIRFDQGERLVVSLSVAAADFVPRWLTRLTSESVVVVRDELELRTH